MILEKLSSFAEGKYDVSPSFHEIATEYEGKNSDVMQRIGEMAITKRIISTCRDRPNSTDRSVSLFSVLQHDWCSPAGRSPAVVVSEGLIPQRPWLVH